MLRACPANLARKTGMVSFLRPHRQYKSEDMKRHYSHWGGKQGHPWKKAFEDFMDSTFGVFDDFSRQRPSINVAELEGSFEVQVAAPGLEKSDFKIQVIGDHLHISANRQPVEEEGREWLRREFHYGDFERRIKISDRVDRKKVKARYEQGVLTVKLPKLKNQWASEGKDIPVE